MTSLTAIERDERIRSGYSIVADAARHVATPQIRNQGTLGGNVAQDTRCWYYRSGWPCYRAGGNTCYAAAPQAMNREHCIMGRSRCVAVNPSDTAPALIAVGAMMMTAVTRIDWKDPAQGLPAFLTVVMMPLTFSIAKELSKCFAAP